MSWLIFTFISILSISVANLFQKVAMRKKESDPIAASIIFQFLLTILTGIFMLIEGFKPPPVRLIFPYFLISAVLYAFSTLLIFKAIKEIEASELAILVGSSSIATIVAASLFLGERLTYPQFAGVFLVLSAVVMANYKRREFKFNKWMALGLLGNVLSGFAITNDAYVLKTYDAISYTPIMSFLPGIVLCIMYFSKLKSFAKQIKSHVNLNLSIYTFLYGIQAVTYYLALQFGASVSKMSTIFKAEIILTILLSAIFLKERKNMPVKIAAAILVTIGIFLLA